jgi:PTS system galactitol-specific IIC component
MQIMDILLNIINNIIGLGAAVFLPFIMFIIGMIFGLKPGKAFRAGLMLGIAFTAIGIFISALLIGQIAPATQAAIKGAGSDLQFLDVGWTAASMISWAWPLAATIFPLQIIINLIMLWRHWTDVLNVDLWNVWQKIFFAAVTYIFTKNLLLAYFVASLLVVIELKLGDYTAEQVQDSTGIPGVCCPHGGMTNLLAVMPIIWIIDRIPGLRDTTFDAEYLKNKLGFLGEPSIIGFIMGIIIGVVGGYDFSKTAKLAVSVATCMLILPRIAALFAEALMPISEAATQFMKKRFPDRKCYIGLDWPFLTANPAVITCSILLIPILLLLAIILPGNKTLPFGDVANFGSAIIGPAVIFKGDIIKSFLADIPILIILLYSSTAMGSTFTQLAMDVGFKLPEGAVAVTYMKSGPVIWSVFAAVQEHWIIAIPLFILFIISVIILKKCYSDPYKRARAAQQQEK